MSAGTSETLCLPEISLQPPSGSPPHGISTPRASLWCLVSNSFKTKDFRTWYSQLSRGICSVVSAFYVERQDLKHSKVEHQRYFQKS